MDPVQRMRDIQHFGEEGGVVPVIDVAATSTFMNPLDMEKAFHGERPGCYLYSRHTNPTVIAFSKKLAALEGAESAIGVASGMAAIHCTLRQLMPKGGHVIASRMVYGGTYALFKNILPQANIHVTFVDMTDHEKVKAAITPQTRVIYTETMSNPLLEISDIPALSKIAKKHGLSLVVDNTFTPVIVQPIEQGADVVVYSCTKYISGASDLLAGAIVGTKAFIDSLIDINFGMIMLTGPSMDARIAHELYLRLDHLPVRMAAHSQSALHLANKLSEMNLPIIYPGLSAHPHHETLKKQMNPSFGFSGMLAFDCGSVERAFLLAERLQNEKFGLYAVSLGFSRTLLSCPAVSTSSEIPEAEQKEMGLTPGLLRISMGIVGNNQILTQRFLDCLKVLN